MEQESPQPGSMGMVGGYAAADFADAEDMRPLGAVFDIGGNGGATPYSTAIGAMMQKHMEEIKGRTTAVLDLRTDWKRRLREFLSKKNTELLDFLKLSVSSHPTLGPGETLLRRFGNPQVSPSHPSVREYVMDGSGARVETVIDDLNTALLTMRTDKPLSDYANMTRILYEEYREAGEAILKAQRTMKGKLDRLDRIQSRIITLFEIEPNEKYEPLLEASEAYLQKIFTDSTIEQDYCEVMEAYRKFIALRDIIVMSRTLASGEGEPLCCICIQEPVSFALVPCGHTFCQACIRRQSANCFMCRTHIKDRVKLYFG